MKHEKVFQLTETVKVKVIVEAVNNFNKTPISYKVSCYLCHKGKRTWSPVVDSDSYEYRRMSMEARAQFTANEYQRIVGEDKILQTANELWNTIKPQFGFNIDC